MCEANIGSPVHWQKSSFSGGEGFNCIEVAEPSTPVVLLRESDDPQVILATTPARFAAFIGCVKAGEFDRL